MEGKLFYKPFLLGKQHFVGNNLIWGTMEVGAGSFGQLKLHLNVENLVGTWVWWAFLNFFVLEDCIDKGFPFVLPNYLFFVLLLHFQIPFYIAHLLMMLANHSIWCLISLASFSFTTPSMSGGYLAINC